MAAEAMRRISRAGFEGRRNIFASSDHYGSDNANQPVASIAGVDHAVTGAVRNTGMAGHKAPDTKMKTITDWPESGQGIWGN